MAGVLSLRDGVDVAVTGVDEGPWASAPPPGADWPACASWSPCLDAGRGVLALNLKLSGNEVELARFCALDELPMPTRLPQPSSHLSGGKAIRIANNFTANFVRHKSVVDRKVKCRPLLTTRLGR